MESPVIPDGVRRAESNSEWTSEASSSASSGSPLKPSASWQSSAYERTQGRAETGGRVDCGGAARAKRALW